MSAAEGCSRTFVQELFLWLRVWFDLMGMYWNVARVREEQTSFSVQLRLMISGMSRASRLYLPYVACSISTPYTSYWWSDRQK